MFYCFLRSQILEHDNRVVALKRLRVQASDEGMPLNTIREIAILRRLVGFEHPNVVSLLDVCCSRRNDHEIRKGSSKIRVSFFLNFMTFENPIKDFYWCLNMLKWILKLLLRILAPLEEYLWKTAVIFRDSFFPGLISYTPRSVRATLSARI